MGRNVDSFFRETRQAHPVVYALQTTIPGPADWLVHGWPPAGRLGKEKNRGEKSFLNLGNMHIFGKPCISEIRKYINQA